MMRSIEDAMGTSRGNVSVKISHTDLKMLAQIHQVCDRGGNVQIKRSPNGGLKVQEIKIHEVKLNTDVR